MPKVIISSRHPSTLEWLTRHYPDLVKDAVVTDHATRAMVRGPDTCVIGTLPIRVIHEARDYFDVGITKAPKGRLETADDLDAAGAELKRYVLLDDGEVLRLIGSVVAAVIAEPPPDPDQFVAWARSLLDDARGWNDV